MLTSSFPHLKKLLGTDLITPPDGDPLSGCVENDRTTFSFVEEIGAKKYNNK